MTRAYIDSAPLLAKIAAYCKHTGTTTQHIGKLSFNHAGYVRVIRHRGRTSLEAEARVLAAMASYPDGITEEIIASDNLLGSRVPCGHRKAGIPTFRGARLDEMDAMPRVKRDPCPFCGVRGDLPCGHNKRAILGLRYG